MLLDTLYIVLLSVNHYFLDCNQQDLTDFSLDNNEEYHPQVDIRKNRVRRSGRFAPSREFLRRSRENPVNDMSSTNVENEEHKSTPEVRQTEPSEIKKAFGSIAKELSFTRHLKSVVRQNKQNEEVEIRDKSSSKVSWLDEWNRNKEKKATVIDTSGTNNNLTTSVNRNAVVVDDKILKTTNDNYRHTVHTFQSERVPRRTESLANRSEITPAIKLHDTELNRNTTHIRVNKESSSATSVTKTSKKPETTVNVQKEEVDNTKVRSDVNGSGSVNEKNSNKETQQKVEGIKEAEFEKQRISLSQRFRSQNQKAYSQTAEEIVVESAKEKITETQCNIKNRKTDAGKVLRDDAKSASETEISSESDLEELLALAQLLNKRISTLEKTAKLLQSVIEKKIAKHKQPE